MTEFDVLGTPLLATTYEELAAQCQAWARGPVCVSMEFANTQIVTMRRHEPRFLELTATYNYFIPDGMPLIWCLNRAGAGLKDRVYGPTFMREFLSKVRRRHPPIISWEVRRNAAGVSGNCSPDRIPVSDSWARSMDGAGWMECWKERPSRKCWRI